ncbi:MAG: hypothetical protein Q9M13_07695 [Mariprofundales bacterium]|nr:hypothetical protein [Mariprofundales bacterium]
MIEDQKYVAVPVDDPLAELKAMPQWGPKWMRFAFAFPVGCLIMQTALSLLNIRIEWFYGLETFSLAWVFSMSILPFISGVAVGVIYGFGGKYLAHFPPALVMGYSYYESVTHALPDGVHLLPWQLFGFYTILLMEFSAFGGVIGELFIRRYIGWDAVKQPEFHDGEALPEDEEMEVSPSDEKR